MVTENRKPERQPSGNYGKMPPQAVELEQAVLGALMLERNAYVMTGELLKPECFYKEAHQRIFGAIQVLFQDDEPIDILTVSEKLKVKGELEQVGGYYYLSSLTSYVASAVHIEFHVKIILQKYIQRKLIQICTELQEMAYDEATDVTDLVDAAQKSIYDIAEGNIRKDSVKLEVAINESVESMVEAAKRTDGISGIPSGFTALDEITSGWQKSDLVIIAARPAMGKTAFILSMARNMAITHKVPLAIFSLEMSAVQLSNRFIAGETGLGSEKIKNGRLTGEEWKQLHQHLQKLIEAEIYIDDTPALSVFELRAKCRRLKQTCHIQAVFVDYLQLMTAGANLRGNREQEVSIISRQLKIIAKELELPVFALSQLNRNVELRTGDSKKPMLADLRESGSIEQDADMVLFIHRPEKYGMMTDEMGNSLKGIANIIIAKHRNGAIGEISLRFISELTQFCDLETFPPFKPGEGIAETITYEERANRKQYQTCPDMTGVQPNPGKDTESGLPPLDTGIDDFAHFYDREEKMPF